MPDPDDFVCCMCYRRVAIRFVEVPPGLEDLAECARLIRYGPTVESPWLYANVSICPECDSGTSD